MLAATYIYEIYEWKCFTDEAKFGNIVETKRVFKFLFGLNQSLGEVRRCILAMKPFPLIREAFSEVVERRVEEK